MLNVGDLTFKMCKNYLKEILWLIMGEYVTKC